MGCYRIVRRVAIGPLAEVFLGAAPLGEGIESPVAIKRLLPQRAADLRVVRRLAHRVGHLQFIEDPSLVRLLEAGTDGEGHYLITEWVDGAALGALMTGAAFRGARLTAGEATFVAVQLARGLAALHEAVDPAGRPLGLLHHQLNPGAVLISRRGEVKLSGLATGRIAAMAGIDPKRHGRGYLAPEVIAGRRHGPAAELFSLGVILWELAAGQRLFASGDPAAVAAFDPADLPPLPGLADPLIDPLRRLLARDPAERFPSARAALDALREYRTAAGLTAGAPELGALLARAIPSMPGADTKGDEFAGELTLEPYDQALFGRRCRGEPTGAVPRPAKPAAPRRRRLGEILIERGQAGPGEIEAALAVQQGRGGRLGEILRERGVVSEMDLVRAVSLQSGVPFVSDEKLDAMPLPRELLNRVPPPVAERYRLVPLTFRDKTLFVATLDPRDEKLLADVKRVAGVPAVKGVFATTAAIDRALIRFYRSVGPADPTRAALSFSLRLLGASARALGSSAAVGPSLSDLAARLARELGGTPAEADTAAVGGYALALAARAEGQVGFTRPARAGLVALLDPELGDAEALLLPAIRETRPAGIPAEALSAAAAFVEAAGSATATPGDAAAVIDALRGDPFVTASALAALDRCFPVPTASDR